MKIKYEDWEKQIEGSWFVLMILLSSIHFGLFLISAIVYGFMTFIIGPDLETMGEFK